VKEKLTFEQIIRASMVQFAREYLEHSGFEGSNEIMDIILKHRVENVKVMLERIGYHKD
jgi:hypothetical protein